MARFVIVTSGKGGVGKTTTALNLAVALKHFGREVLVLDSNFLSPHVGLHLGYTNFRVHLHHVLKGEKHIKESIYRHQSGIKIVPASLSLDHLPDADAEKLNAALKDLHQEAEVVLLDAGVGLAPSTRALLKEAHDLIVVTTPELSSVADTLKVVKIARAHKVNILGVVVNKVEDDGLDMTIENIQAILELPILAVIPSHIHVREAAKLKQPVAYSHPTSPVTDSYKKLAGDLIGEKYEAPVGKEEEDMVDTILDKMSFDYVKGKFSQIQQDLKKRVQHAKKE